MKFSSPLKTKFPLLITLGLLFTLSACGSYEYIGANNDGIYGASSPVPAREYSATTPQTTYRNNNNGEYYKNYFKQEEQKITSDGGIFTDVDDYVTTPSAPQSNGNNYQGQPGWGQNPSRVTVNYINSGFNGWNTPYYNNWGWNRWDYDWNYGYSPFLSRPYNYGGFYYGGWAYRTPRYGFYYSSPYDYYYGYNNRRYYRYNTRGPRNISYSATRRLASSNRNSASSYRNRSNAVVNNDRYNRSKSYRNLPVIDNRQSGTNTNAYNKSRSYSKSYRVDRSRQYKPGQGTVRQQGNYRPSSRYTSKNSQARTSSNTGYRPLSSTLRRSSNSLIRRPVRLNNSRLSRSSSYRPRTSTTTRKSYTPRRRSTSSYKPQSRSSNNTFNRSRSSRSSSSSRGFSSGRSRSSSSGSRSASRRR